MARGVVELIEDDSKIGEVLVICVTDGTKYKKFGQLDSQKDKQIDRQTDRQTDIQTHCLGLTHTNISYFPTELWMWQGGL